MIYFLEHCVPLEFASEQPIDEVVNNLPSKFLNTNTNTISKSDFNVPNENTNVEKPSKLEPYEPTKTIEIIERVSSVDHDSLYKLPVPAEYDNNLSRNLDASVTPYDAENSISRNFSEELGEDENELGMEYETRQNNNSLSGLDWSIPDPPSGFKDSITPTLEKDNSQAPFPAEVNFFSREIEIFRYFTSFCLLIYNFNIF